MASCFEFRCKKCSFTLSEYYCIVRKEANGKSTLYDQRYCHKCNRITQCHYEDAHEVDPEMDNMLKGNSGRILRYLKENGPLIFSNWPSKSGLPSPMKFKKVSRSLVKKGMINVTDEGVFIREGISDRIEPFYRAHPCGECNTNYTPLQQCPECGNNVLHVAMFYLGNSLHRCRHLI